MTEPSDLLRRILYQDANVIVLDKPAGLAVHGGPATPVHLEAMLPVLALGRSQPPQLAHRLDRDTAGCLVLARHERSRSRLGRLFGAGAIGKLYWAVVAGQPDGDQGEIDLPLLKLNARSGWRMVGDPAGRQAHTRWRVLGRAGDIAWLEMEPASGRTHQIRVHCASGLSCPVLGDPVYGRVGPPLHLLSRRLVIPYWRDRPPIVVTAPVPPHMRNALEACGWKGESEQIPAQ